MNMLNPQMRALASFTKEEQEQITSLLTTDFLYLEGGDGLWEEGFNYFGLGEVYRLILKEGEWYTFDANGANGISNFLKEEDDAIYFKDETGTTSIPKDTFKSIRPATPEEIDSMKPKFNRGDVVVCNDGDILRINCSIIGSCGFVFQDPCVLDSEIKRKVNKEELKGYELEEMKAGKKWNGEGYDDWLTEDGLTWNELMECDMSKIEYKFINNGWLQNLNNIDSFKKGVGINDINKYRLKPKETFVDVEIIWDDTTAETPLVTCPWKTTHELRNIVLGIPVYGWVLSGFVFPKNIDEGTIEGAMKFGNMGKRIVSKATHARFVKVGK